MFNDDGLEFDNFTSLGWEWSPADHTHLSVNDNIVHHRNHGNLFMCAGVVFTPCCSHSDGVAW